MIGLGTTANFRERPAGVSRRGFLAIGGGLGSAALLSACGASTGAAKTTKIRYQGTAGAVIPAELAADLGYLGDVTLEWSGNTTSGPQDIQSVATGQTDVGGAFNGSVAKLKAQGAQITSVISNYGVNQLTYNGFFTVAGSPIHSAADLTGKKVGMNTLGAHYEAVLDLYLARNGVDAKSVEPLVVTPLTTELSLRQGQIDVGVLSGVLQDKAIADGGLSKLFSDYQLLGAFSAGTYVFRDAFIAANPDTVQAFTSGVARAIEWARTTPREAVVARMTKIVQSRGRNESTSTLKYFKSYGVAGTGGVIATREFQTWIDWLEQRGTLPKGQVTAAGLFTNRFNPYSTGKAGTP